ncbi:MAG: hypothetical protein M3Z22_07450 [Verrucomicrobiota bacterium]|nr:hypothetical protein [Verrucomicrobiota bacterium]
MTRCSERQRAVAFFISAGKRDTEIAQFLGFKPRTYQPTPQETARAGGEGALG